MWWSSTQFSESKHDLFRWVGNLLNEHGNDCIQGWRADLHLLLRQLHMIKNAEDNPEEILPPVPLKGVAVALHDLEHYCEASATSTQTFLCDCNQTHKT